MLLDLIFTGIPLPHSASRSIFLLLRGQKLGSWEFFWGMMGQDPLRYRGTLCVSSSRLGSYVERAMADFSL